MTVWNAMSAPAATSRPIIERLAAASLSKALDNPDTRKRFDDLAVPVPAVEQRGPAVLETLIAAEVERWGVVFKDVTPPAQ